MKKVEENYDVVVLGGGLAGFCAAVAAARKGAKTCIVQNRPVFGGNSSSEIGVTPHGAAAFHAYARETGILSELLIEERSKNHADIYENGWTNSVWDLTMYDMAVATENLTIHLNTDFYDVIMDGDSEARNLDDVAGEADLSAGYYHRPSRNPEPRAIKTVIARTQNAETELYLSASTFIDCTGDGLVADRAGCEWRMGSESREEFGEPHAPAEASVDTMGNSIHFRARNVGRSVEYKASEWAMHYDDASFFYEQGRVPKEERGGFWWLEIGVPYHTIHDNEKIRHELTRHALGVWEWMKNHDPIMKEKTKNYALDWIGQVPGKRESRRVVGEYFMTEHDIQNCTVFEDEVAFGGWFVDLHTPGGLLAPTSEPASAEGNYDTFCEYAVKSYCGPYGIPLRCMIARDVPNLMVGGRCVSVTHAALGTLRVMATTALMGQAAGVAAACGLRRGLALRDLAAGEPIEEIKQTLLRDGAFLPNYVRDDSRDLATAAIFTASSERTLSGAGPETEGAHEGLAVWRDQPQYQMEVMECRKAQLIAVGDEGLQTIRLCVSNSSDATQSVELELNAVEHIWDYRVKTGALLKSGSVEVAPGDMQWISWDVNLSASELPEAGRYVRVDMMANPNLSWHVAGCVLPGHVGYYQIGENKYRRFGNGVTLSFETVPAQSCFAASQVSGGATRPHAKTNLWCSDPSQPLPQSLEWSWEKPQAVAQVELTFPGHLLREYHAYAPFYADGQCPRVYRIEAEVDGQWRTVAEMTGNVQRHCIHRFDPVVSSRFRLVISETNGDPSAQVYEVRCYAEAE